MSSDIRKLIETLEEETLIEDVLIESKKSDLKKLKKFRGFIIQRLTNANLYEYVDDIDELEKRLNKALSDSFLKRFFSALTLHMFGKRLDHKVNYSFYFIGDRDGTEYGNPEEEGINYNHVVSSGQNQAMLGSFFITIELETVGIELLRHNPKKWIYIVASTILHEVLHTIQSRNLSLLEPPPDYPAPYEDDFDYQEYLRRPREVEAWAMDAVHWDMDNDNGEWDRKEPLPNNMSARKFRDDPELWTRFMKEYTKFVKLLV
jgi:hypothetical protein